MPKKYGNRIKVNSATTGTGVISLGTAVEGYQNFSSGGITDGSSVSYVIEDGANFEIGVGTYTASGTQLSRTVSESTNSDNAINLSGEAVIFITPAASDLPFTDGASFSGAVTFAEDVTFDGATAGRDIVFDRSDNALEFADNAKAKFGSGNDLEVYHASDSSYIDEVGGGSLFIRSNGPNVFIGKTTGSEYMGVFTPDGAVSLRYDNATKFETTSSGINVTGTVTDDGAVHDGDVTFTGASYSAFWDKSESHLHFNDRATLSFGGSSSAPDMVIEHNNALNLNRIRGSNITIQDADGHNIAVFQEDAGAVLYFNGSQKAEVLTGGFDVTGDITVTGTVDGRDLAVDGTKLDGIAVNATSNPNALNDLVDDGSPQLGGALQLNGNNIQANDSTSVVNNRIQLGTSQDLQLYHNGTNSSIENVTGQLDIINSAENQDVVIKSDDGFGNLSEYFRADGSNGSARLFHYGSEKISTRGDGVVLTGNIINTSGDMTLDVAGDLALDVGGATIFFKDDGATWGYIENQTTDGAFDIKSSTNNYDMRFRGTDNGSTITALTLDMSNAGAATFNDDVKLSDYKRVKLGNGGDLQLLHDGGGTSHISNYTGHLYISNYSDDADIKIQTDNGQGNVTDYILADGSDGSVHLMHYGSTKLQTLNTGVNVSGDITFDASSDEKVGAESSRTFLTGNLGSQLRAGNNTKVAATTTGVELTGATVQNGDFTFTGASYNAVWDKSANSLRFADNAKAVFGDGSDASIHWNGSALEFSSELGDVLIRGNNEIKLQAHTGENFFVGLSNGASTLYYDNSAKLATSSSGVTITGTLAATAVTGDGSGLTNLPASSDSTKMPLAGGTFTGDVTFSGTNHSGVTWDTSSDEFLFAEGSRIDFGGGANIRRESDGILRITGATADDTYFNFSNNLIFYRGGSAAAQMMIDGSTQRFHAFGNITVGGTVDGVDIATNIPSTLGSAGQVLTVNSGGTAGEWADGAVSNVGTGNFIGGTNAGANLASGGTHNTLLGNSAGDKITTGDRNVAIGFNPMGTTAAVTGSDNIGIGHDALEDITSANYNIGIGRNAGASVTTGTANVFLGYDAGQSATTGGYNVALGIEAGHDLTSGYQNVALGYRSGYYIDTGFRNVAIGSDVMQGSGSVSGYDNIGMGQSSLHDLTSGHNNVALGNQSAKLLTTGTHNIAIGLEALQSITTESYCTAVGHAAGSSNTGANNTSFGAFALRRQGTGTDNSAFGRGALSGNSFNDFSRNTAVGASAGNLNTGNDNTFIGAYAGDNVTSGTNNTVIGKSADASSATVSNEITIGSASVTRFRVPAAGIDNTSAALSGTTPSIDVSARDTYTITTSGNTTFSFANPPASPQVGTFSLILTAGGTHTVTWPSSVDWAGGSAPDAPASGEKDIYTFMTVDGGTNWYGFLAADAIG